MLPAATSPAAPAAALGAAAAVLAACGITDLDALATRCVAARNALGQPTGRWTSHALALAIQLAVTHRGWPPATVAPALLAVAADPATRSPVRLAEAGPWWDTPTGAGTSVCDTGDHADLAVLEARLSETGGRRPALQAQARTELTKAGLARYPDHSHSPSDPDPRPPASSGVNQQLQAMPATVQTAETQQAQAPPPRGRRRAPGRDRDHQQPARTQQIKLRVSCDEDTAIAAAARDAGLTPSGYAAEAALAAATNAQPPSSAPWRTALAELIAARNQVRRIGTNINQATHILNADGQPPLWLKHALAITERSIQRLDLCAAAVQILARHQTDNTRLT